MALFKEERYTSGAIQVGGMHEARVKEWIVRDTSSGVPVNSEDLKDVPGIPIIGDLWESAVGSDDQSGPRWPGSGAGTTSPLKLQRLDFRAEGPFAVNMIGYFGTQKHPWEFQRHVEISTQEVIQKFDYDADTTVNDPDQLDGPGRRNDNCKHWWHPDIQGITNQQEQFGYAKMPPEAQEALEGKYTLTISGMFFNPPFGAISDTVATTNATSLLPDFPEQDRWLFLGATGKEERDSVWKLSFRFAYDFRNWRHIDLPKRDGSLFRLFKVRKLGDPETIDCYSRRRYRRADWGGWYFIGP